MHGFPPLHWTYSISVNVVVLIICSDWVLLVTNQYQNWVRKYFRVYVVLLFVENQNRKYKFQVSIFISPSSHISLLGSASRLKMRPNNSLLCFILIAYIMLSTDLALSKVTQSITDRAEDSLWWHHRASSICTWTRKRNWNYRSKNSFMCIFLIWFSDWRSCVTNSEFTELVKKNTQ